MEEQSFHPLDYTAVVRRRKWWLIVPVVVCVDRRRAARDVPAEAVPVAGDHRRGRPDALAGAPPRRQLARQGRAAARDLAAAAEPDGPRARRARGEDRPGKPVDETAAWLRANVSQNIAVPHADRQQAVDPEAGSTASFSATPTATRTSAAHRQPPGVRLRRGELEAATERVENTSEVLSQQLQASQERLTQLEDQLRDEEAGLHGPASRPGQRQHADGQRPAQSARLDLDAAPHRAGSSDDGGIAARADAAGHGFARPSPPRRVAAVQAAQKRISDLSSSSRRRARGYTDKHPE